MKNIILTSLGYACVAIFSLWMLFVVEPFLFSSNNPILIALGVLTIVSPAIAAVFVIRQLILDNKNK